MLLPQSQAYKTLSDRLSTVSSLQIHLGFGSGALSSSSNERDGGSTIKKLVTDTTKATGAELGTASESGQAIDYDDLMQRFQIVQERHIRSRLNLIRSKALRPQEDA